MVTDAWPKFGQPDFTEVITKILQAKPQALYTLVRRRPLRLHQPGQYLRAVQSDFGVLAQHRDYPVLTAVKSLPAGISSGARYLTTFPETPQNKAWGDAYFERYNE